MRLHAAMRSMRPDAPSRNVSTSKPFSWRSTRISSMRPTFSPLTSCTLAPISNSTGTSIVLLVGTTARYALYDFPRDPNLPIDCAGFFSLDVQFDVAAGGPDSRPRNSYLLTTPGSPYASQTLGKASDCGMYASP